MHDLEVHQAELETQNAELRAAQLFLQQTRDRYYDLFHHAPVGYVVLDGHGRIVDVNHTWCEWCDEDREQLIGSFFDRLLDPVSAREFDGRFKAIYKTPQGKDLQLRLRHRPSPSPSRRARCTIPPGTRIT
jgi:PAS domain-containing protein